MNKFELTIDDYIDIIDNLVDKYGVELELLAWQEIQDELEYYRSTYA